MLTMQEVFNKVCDHLLAQGARSETDPNSDMHVCAYRGANDMQCAVGCLIKDEYYSPGLEGLSGGAVAVKKALEQSGVNAYGFTNPTFQLLRELQRLHDHVLPESWPAELCSIAQHHQLQQPPSLVAAVQAAVALAQARSTAQGAHSAPPQPAQVAQPA